MDSSPQIFAKVPEDSLKKKRKKVSPQNEGGPFPDSLPAEKNTPGDSALSQFLAKQRRTGFAAKDFREAFPAKTTSSSVTSAPPQMFRTQGLFAQYDSRRENVGKSFFGKRFRGTRDKSSGEWVGEANHLMFPDLVANYFTPKAKAGP